MEIKVLKSGIWYTVANFLLKSITFITTPIFARMLSHSEFGLYNNFTSWMSTLTVLVTLNLESTFISAKYEYERKFDEYVFSVLILSTISGLFWLVFGVLFSRQISAISGINILYLICLWFYLIVLPALNMFQTRERFFYRYRISVFVSLFVAISTALVSLILVTKMENRLTGRIIGSVMPTIFVGSILYIIIGIRGKRIEVSFWKYALPICLPFIPHLMSLTLLNSMDKIMITKICGAEDNALYSIAYTCGSIITLLITSMNTAFSPWLGDQLNVNEIDKITKVSKRYIAVFVGLAVGIMLITPELLLMMGGTSYLNAVFVMPPVAFGCICQFLYTMYVNIEQFKKKTIGMALASISAALLNFILNLWLIPLLGYIAAAYTTLVSFLWLLIAHMLLVRHLGYSKIYPTKFIFLTLGVMLIYTILVNFLYSMTLIRYTLIGLYMFAVVYIGYKHRKYFSLLLKERQVAS